jgi:hypothetical protein
MIVTSFEVVRRCMASILRGCRKAMRKHGDKKFACPTTWRGRKATTSGPCTKYSRLVPIEHSLDALSCAEGNKTGRRLTVGSNPSHPESETLPLSARHKFPPTWVSDERTTNPLWSSSWPRLAYPRARYQSLLRVLLDQHPFLRTPSLLARIYIRPACNGNLEQV